MLDRNNKYALLRYLSYGDCSVEGKYFRYLSYSDCSVVGKYCRYLSYGDCSVEGKYYQSVQADQGSI